MAAKIDKYALAMEIAMLYEAGQKVDFNELAPKVGSASGNSLRMCWNGHKKAYKSGSDNSTDTVLSPVSTDKVQKWTKKGKPPATDKTTEKETPATKKAKANKAKKQNMDAYSHVADEGSSGSQNDVIKEEGSDFVNMGREIIGIEDDKSGLWAAINE